MPRGEITEPGPSIVPAPMSGFKVALAFGAIILGFFMALLDATIVNVSLPEMVKAYGASVDSISWIVNGYNLAFAVFILTAARLADQFGRKRVFLVGLVAFVVSSVAAGFAPSVEFLIAMRVVQGLAGAVVVPVTVPLAAALFPKEKHGMMLGIWGAIAGLAAASGPPLGGLLTSALGWQAIFFVNLPIGIVSVFMTLVLIRESTDPDSGKRVDIPGVVLASLAMFALVYALINAHEWGWGSVPILALFGFSLLTWIAFVIVENKSPHPMLPMELLRIRVFNGAVLTIFAIGAGVIGSIFLMSFYLRAVMNYDVLGAGLMLAVTSLASMVASAVSGPLSARFDSRYFSVGGLVVMALALYSYTGLSELSAPVDVIWRLAVMGIGMGMSFAPVMGSAIRSVPDQKIGMASGISNMSRALGGVLGVALIVTVMNAGLESATEKARSEAHSIVASDTVVDAELKQAIDQVVDRIRLTAASGETAASVPEETAVPDNGAEAAPEGALPALIGVLNQREAAALASAPDEMKDNVRSAFAAQRTGATALFERVRARFVDGSVDAFRTTFGFAAVLVLAGIVSALMSDRRPPKRAESAHEEPKPKPVLTAVE